MKKIKSILAICIIAIIAIIGINTTSLAGNWSQGVDWDLYYRSGSPIVIDYYKHYTDNYIYCLQMDTDYTGGQVYKIMTKITIEGDKATEYNKNMQPIRTVTSDDNILMAYAINNATNVPNAYNLNSIVAKNMQKTQKTMWRKAQDWLGKFNPAYRNWSSNCYIHNGGGYGLTAYDNEIFTMEEAKANYKKSDIKDLTNKNNIRVTLETRNNAKYAVTGPYKWDFEKLDKITASNGTREIREAVYSVYEGTTRKEVNASQIKSQQDFYVSVPLKDFETGTITLKGEQSVNVYGAELWIWKNIYSNAFQTLMNAKPSQRKEPVELNVTYNLQGNLVVIKYDKDTQQRLDGVGFIIQNTVTGKYIKQETDGKITYVENKENATEFATNANGEITLNNLLIGEYKAYETKNPHYGYEIYTEGFTTTKQEPVLPNSTSKINAPNERKFIKVSGFVWEDMIDGKKAIRNHKYNTPGEETADGNDKLVANVTVNLKDVNGNIISTKLTDANGKYEFADVLIDNLDKYYIEFIYNGMSYQNVEIGDLKASNTSKASEGDMRTKFNNKFQVITNNKATGTAGELDIKYDRVPSEENGTVLNSVLNFEGNPTYGYPEATAPINNIAEKYLIDANTRNVYNGYLNKIQTPEEIRKNATEELTNINLGLYRREQPDLSIKKDIKNVKLSINGYNHIYEYEQRFLNQGEYGDGFNVGVKFGNRYGQMKYTRAIYKADYEYRNELDQSRELKVYITYRIGIKNNSSNLIAKVNEIAEYYDNRYEQDHIVVGTGIDQSGNITGQLNATQLGDYNNEYRKMVINTEGLGEIERQSAKDVYVQFKFSREAVEQILGSGETLDNVTEITAYSIFDENGVYAGIDQNSNPGSCNPTDTNTFEDDTDHAPALQLEVADNARKLTGKVFEDQAIKEKLEKENIRQGNGALDENEVGTQNVEVEMATIDENAQIQPVKTTTSENGDFEFEGFIPGNYVITYTWGDETYTVQDYKSTIFDEASHQGDKWYKNVDKRLSDATDDYNTRLAIDEEIKTLRHDTKTTIDKMKSNTPNFGVGVEYDSAYTASTGDKYQYLIKDIDFGIIERPVQSFKLDKEIRNLKVTLQNGQVIEDATIKDGKITGEQNKLVYLGPVKGSNAGYESGMAKLELDNEITQGATVEITYEINVTNTSELDYVDEGFYKYGTIPERRPVVMMPTKVIDYLDKGWAYNQNETINQENKWQNKEINDIKGEVSSSVYENQNSKIKDRIILYTNKIEEDRITLEPGQSLTSPLKLKATKVLTTINDNDIELNNETEIIELKKTGGRTLQNSTPGNYVPGSGYKVEADDDMAETFVVAPNTGENLSFLMPVVIGVMALIVLGTGIIFIKREVLDKKKTK